MGCHTATILSVVAAYVDEMKQPLPNVSRGVDHNIIDCAIDKNVGIFEQCAQANYGHLSNC